MLISMKQTQKIENYSFYWKNWWKYRSKVKQLLEVQNKRYCIPAVLQLLCNWYCQVVNILESRNNEEAKPMLSISVYNVERNEKARKYRQEQVIITFQFMHALKWYTDIDTGTTCSWRREVTKRKGNGLFSTISCSTGWPSNTYKGTSSASTRWLPTRPKNQINRCSKHNTDKIWTGERIKWH